MLRALSSVLLLLAAAGAEGETLRIGLIPEQNIFRQVERHLPLVRYLERRAGVGLDCRMMRSYGDLLEGLRLGELDGGFAGSYVGSVAISQLGARPVVRIEYRDGRATYSGLIFVRRGSGIRSVADMKDRVLAYVDRATTAGFVFPSSYFRLHGVPIPEDHFREIFFAGSHDAALRAVLDGAADVGCAKDTVFRRLAKTDSRVGRELQIVARSPEVPSVALIVSAAVDRAVEERVRETLRAMESDPEGQQVLAEFGARSFLPTRVEDYEPVAALIGSAGSAASKGGSR